jgi:hypothetical protein
LGDLIVEAAMGVRRDILMSYIAARSAGERQPRSRNHTGRRVSECLVRERLNLVGERIFLRDYQESDRNFYHSWISDPSIMKYVD